MKIVLPRTLAEPLTIPWITLTGNTDKLATTIIEAIREFFRNAERSNEIPTDDWDAWGKSQFSLVELLDILQTIALLEGAETSKAIEIGCSYGDKFVGEKIAKNAWRGTGFSFRVTFKLKHSWKTYHTDIDFWYNPKRPTVYR